MSFKLPELPYNYDALEPYIDKETMEVHYTKHHQGYTDKLNKAVSGTPLENQTIEEILSNVSQHDDAVRNNGGGFYNHNLFWRCMSPAKEQQQMPESLQTVLEQDFSSVEEFREQFSRAATGRFGSGWA